MSDETRDDEALSSEERELKELERINEEIARLERECPGTISAAEHMISVVSR